jgi:hypothetical protein
MREVYIVNYCSIESSRADNEIIGVYESEVTAMAVGLAIAKSRIHNTVTFRDWRFQREYSGDYVSVSKMEVQP